MRDALQDAINHPSGRLAEVLIKKLEPSRDGSMEPKLQERFDKLASASGRFGYLARIRFAAEVSLLFERAPTWTAERVVPLFDWTYSEAKDAWNARKYSNYIGSPKLFELTKEPFLRLFAMPDLAEDDIRVFAEWLTAIVIANQSENIGYPISQSEARSALRSAGSRALPSVAHRLGSEMARAKPDEKLDVWAKVVAPVFKSIWPLDTELQTETATYALVRLLRESGKAFPDAANSVLPFIKPESPRRQTSMYSLSTADETLYAQSPQKMLALLTAVIDDAPPKSIYGLTEALNKLKKCAPDLVSTKQFQRLERMALPLA